MTLCGQLLGKFGPPSISIVFLVFWAAAWKGTKSCRAWALLFVPLFVHSLVSLSPSSLSSLKLVPLGLKFAHSSLNVALSDPKLGLLGLKSVLSDLKLAREASNQLPGLKSALSVWPFGLQTKTSPIRADFSPFGN